MYRITHLAILSMIATSLGCEEETLTPQIARIVLIPQLEGAQTALVDPPGIELGQVPLHGLGIARFAIENRGSAELRISGATVASPVGGTFTVEHFTEELPAATTDDDAGELVITFSPEADGATGYAIIQLQTNSGASGEDIAEAQVRGVGLFVGNPKVQVCYAGDCYPTEPQCADRGDGKTLCSLPTLDFGNVPLETSATQEVVLRNVPPAGTCLLPPGSPECTPVCQLTFDRDPDAYDLGLGFSPDDGRFAVEANVPIPFTLDVENPQCAFTSEIRLLVSFTADATEGEYGTTLVLENNDPTATLIEIPLTAAARKAPVAVAQIVECDGVNLPPACVLDADAIRPLDRAYFDGSDSYDTGLPARPITVHHWQVIEWPLGAPTEDFDLQGEDSVRSSMWLPLAGRYTVRLRVANDLGIESGVSDTSDVTFEAIPSSRLHIQLIWDIATNDQDLHVTHASQNDRVCDSDYDCFWGNCKPSCPDAEGCRTDTFPPQWVLGDARSEGGNPRLDIDDTHGLGPENINIDAPAVGRYRVYVHHYGLVDLTNFPTQNTVRIYIDGVLRGQYSRQLSRNDLWRVAEIEWDIDGNADVRVPASDGGGVGQVKQLVGCRTEGFDFGPF